jgi:hypothetical protein
LYEPLQSKRPFEIIINLFFIPTTGDNIVELIGFFTILWEPIGIPIGIPIGVEELNSLTHPWKTKGETKTYEHTNKHTDRLRERERQRREQEWTVGRGSQTRLL